METEKNADLKKEERSQIVDLGSDMTRSEKGNIYTLTIIGQIEGHQVAPETVKTTKYEHVLPLLAGIEESDDVDGLLLLLNTVGGDIEAGLAIAEMIAGMKKPTVSLVLGGGHSIGIPLAAGVFIPLGLTLNPMFGAAAMSLSSFCVVSNALRLNLFDLHSAKRDHPPKHVPALPAALVQPAAEEDTTASNQKEETAMKKTLTVEGMMCPHCEARVKKALEALPQVDKAVVSHEAGTAIVTLNAEVDDEVLKKAVEAQDYPVTGIQ